MNNTLSAMCKWVGLLFRRGLLFPKSPVSTVRRESEYVEDKDENQDQISNGIGNCRELEMRASDSQESKTLVSKQVANSDVSGSNHIAQPNYREREKAKVESQRSWLSKDQINALPGDLRELIGERLASLDPSIRAIDDKWAVEAVDVLDEVNAYNREDGKDDAMAVELLQATIIPVLAQYGYRLLDSGKWDSSIQRVVSVVAVDGVDEPVVVERGATGISRDGKIVRKQEVVLGKKGELRRAV